MTITPKPKNRPNAFSRWLQDKRAQLGAALDELSTEFKATPPTRPATSARHRRAVKEEEVIRIPADAETPDHEGAEATELWQAWARGESNVSLYTGKGSRASLGDRDRHQRAPHVVPGPDPYAPVVTIHEADVYKTERTLYMVAYKMAGGDYGAGPYLTEEIAREHADDIRKLEGVSSCYVVPLTAEDLTE